MKKFIFIFPHRARSGHEAMASRLLAALDLPTVAYMVGDAGRISVSSSRCSTKGFSNVFLLSSTLVVNRTSRQYSNAVVLVSGSPYGHPVLKIVLKLFRFRIFEYVPFPEMKIVEDRMHHGLVKFINKNCVHSRILIDFWQISESVVQETIIVRNVT